MRLSHPRCLRPLLILIASLSSAFVTSKTVAQESAPLPTGEDLLKQVDAHAATPTDSFALMHMTIRDSAGKEKIREATIKQKGTQKRLFKFTAPADMKGVGVLALEDDVMYVYMPAFKKVKRLASSSKNDKFMGSDFTYDDMGEMTFVDNYTVTKVRAEGESYVLNLKPKKAESSWDHLEMWVRKSDGAHTQVDYYSKKSGEKERSMTRSKFREDDGRSVADEMELKDLLHGSSTKIEIKEAKSNNGFSDSEFSQRYLKR